MKSIREVKAWAETVGLQYRKINDTHMLVLPPVAPIFAGGQIRERFIENANLLRRWYEKREA